MTKRMADGKTGKKVNAPPSPPSPLVLFGRKSSLGHCLVSALPLWEERQDKDKTATKTRKKVYWDSPRVCKCNPPYPPRPQPQPNENEKDLAETQTGENFEFRVQDIFSDAVFPCNDVQV
jgi:hypothetical protein